MLELREINMLGATLVKKMLGPALDKKLCLERC